MVGSKVSFHRQRVKASRITRKSNKYGGALVVQCRTDKILVANRGGYSQSDRTAHEMGISCVADYYTINKDALHAKLANEAVCIGETPNNQLYLIIPKVLSATISHGCTMLHPGYEFLFENVVFVEMCREHRIIFIGPNPGSIRVMGDKATAQ